MNIKKSVLDPTQLILFLGFLVDLENGRISVPPSKLKAITADVRRIRESPRLTVRKLASILGTLRSLAPAVPHVRILSDIVSTLNDIIRELWTFCQDNDLTITPFYVPSLLNPADAPSRRPWGTAQATLHKWTFGKITSFFDLKPVKRRRLS